MTSNRRDFLINSSAFAAGLGITSLISSKTMANISTTAPSSRVNIAVIGVGMGCRDLQGALTDNPWVHCIAMCDVNNLRLEEQAARFKKDFPGQASNIRLYSDFRKLLENKEIDGVIIATPDHWHTYIFAEALKAGKAVYVEKPVANSVEECNVLMDLQNKYNRVVTTGLWQTSQKYFVGANEILKTGVLGDVYKVQLWLSQGTDPRPRVEDSLPPSTLDYDMWLGPAPERTFNSYRVRSWRSFWHYGGGQQTDWGVHWIDSAFDGLQALGLSNREFPKAVFSTAYKNKGTFNETPSCQTTIFQYDNFHIEWAQQVAFLYNRNQGVAWIGSKATLVCNRDGYELIPQLDRNNETSVEPVKLVGKFEEGGIEAHTTNWCNCIRENSMQTNSPIDKGAFATILAHMANISYRSGTRVVYDPEKRRFVNNPAADLYVMPKYRHPWKLPVI
jgi:predicted dehydrogenase